VKIAGGLLANPAYDKQSAIDVIIGHIFLSIERQLSISRKADSIMRHALLDTDGKSQICEYSTESDGELFSY